MSDDTATDAASNAANNDVMQTRPRDYRDTLFLPKTEFPMRAGLPKREPGILEHWRETDLYRQLREAARGRKKYILHDGPPYANGNIHMGTGLNKVLKDIVVRSQQMLGWDANYVPGWDCHGLPIEWKIEEQYRAKGRDKDQVPVNEFRLECREFAEKWIDVQRAEFKRLGVIGDWDNPYRTMDFKSEAQIARELMKFATAGRLYRGSKPVMWSVVEKTALAEAEVEYHDVVSDTIWVKFAILKYAGPEMNMGEDENIVLIPEVFSDASILIWTTTPWTIPGNRAIAFSTRNDVDYGLYEVKKVPDGNWAKVGEKFVIADTLAQSVKEAAHIEEWERRCDVPWGALEGTTCRHPLHHLGYNFDVPLLEGDHVTDEAGTGFVHTAPGHGREDYDVWVASEAALLNRNIDTTIPFTVDADGIFTQDAPGFEGKRVLKPNGKKGDANDAVIKALVDAGALIARSRLTHSYPHSWRSKAPVIFRNTPQWFIPMQDSDGADGLRGTALNAISQTRFVPPAGQRRLQAMVENRPDWVISRQRAWGVPITIFRNTHSGDLHEGELLPGDHPDFKEESEKLITRIADAFEVEGADAWFANGAKQRFLTGLVDNLDDWEQVTDILDVWFDSGSTHAFCLEKRDDLSPKRKADGGEDYVLYLEGSDQHRGWFQSSLLESCGTRGHAPFDAVLTHGFVMTDDGRKMSKSLGNDIPPQTVSEQYGADILRLWVASSDYWEDLRIGPEIIKSNVDAYRKLRNTLRFLLGNLSHFDPSQKVEPTDMPELERYILHRLAELDAAVRQAYDGFDFKRVTSTLFNFAILDLSAFYFDIRKDALYCDPASSTVRLSALTVLDKVFECLTAWLAPVLCFTMEEAWAARHGDDAGSVHLRQFTETPIGWRNDAIAGRWTRIRQIRRTVTGALEVERREKRIGSSLEAAPTVYINDELLWESANKVDFAEIAITSQINIEFGEGPTEAFRMPEVLDVAVVPGRAAGNKCARSWKILPEVGSDPDYPDLSLRDAAAMRERAASTGE